MPARNLAENKGCFEGVRQFPPLKIGRFIGLNLIYLGARELEWLRRKDNQTESFLKSLGYVLLGIPGLFVEGAGWLAARLSLAYGLEIRAADQGWTPQEITKDAYLHK